MDYLVGFGNEHLSEAEKGSVPEILNNPQQPPKGLHAEQLSGSAFTAPQHENFRTWFYRIHPTVGHQEYRLDEEMGHFESGPFGGDVVTPPNPFRFDPLPIPSRPTDFLKGVRTMMGLGDPKARDGFVVHLYGANQSMQKDHAICNHDGDFIFLPWNGGIRIQTEFGSLEVGVGEIAVIQRGMKFRVDLLEEQAQGYLGELYGTHFKLPDHGPIGSNSLAARRHFEVPTAQYENKSTPTNLSSKFLGQWFRSQHPRGVFDVAGWFGNYTPYKYDLRKFNVIGSISFDHPDPSIFTVLTAPSAVAGTGDVDFAIFPPRVLAMIDTFRPPWYHRNIASEYMGLLLGEYDAKEGGGFVPGGGSLHNCMCGHGPDATTLEKASAIDTTKPQYLKDTMAFMFETKLPFQLTRFAFESGLMQRDYLDCWSGIPTTSQI